MRERVRQAIERQALLQAGEPLWVAVSGGVDSMVLLHVLRELGHPCHAAHVDHDLRGGESDADVLFVRTYCEERSIPFRSIKVDVVAQAALSGGSVQSAARALRYEWFGELVEQGPKTLALAHHGDDAIETLFIHLMRGMGLHGWETIPPRSGAFIRPLLAEGRESIMAYAMRHGIQFREDGSNADPKYLRNRVRHELLPLLETWRPGTHRTLGRNVALLRELDALAQQHVAEVLSDIAPGPDGTTRIPFARILEGRTPRLVLYRALGHLGLHPDRYEDLIDAISNSSVGASFPAGDHRVFVDREELVIAPVVALRSWAVAAPANLDSEVPLRFASCDAADVDLAQGPTVAWLDVEALRFPLELRPWRHGDRMHPIGLGGSKLVSDMLIDAKVPRDRKAHCYVLVSGGAIVWLCGLRIAEGFQAKATSRSVWRCEWEGATK